MRAFINLAISDSPLSRGSGYVRVEVGLLCASVYSFIYFYFFELASVYSIQIDKGMCVLRPDFYVRPFFLFKLRTRVDTGHVKITCFG